jgi:hypothetical protein
LKKMKSEIEKNKNKEEMEEILGGLEHEFD